MCQCGGSDYLTQTGDTPPSNSTTSGQSLLSCLQGKSLLWWIVAIAIVILVIKAVK